jgi:hypothetical protein
VSYRNIRVPSQIESRQDVRELWKKSETIRILKPASHDDNKFVNFNGRSSLSKLFNFATKEVKSARTPCVVRGVSCRNALRVIG